jgi:hypothetical protein
VAAVSAFQVLADPIKRLFVAETISNIIILLAQIVRHPMILLATIPVHATLAI